MKRFLWVTAALAIGCGQSGNLSTGSSGPSGPTSSSSSGSGGSAMAEPLKIFDWNTHNFFDDKLDATSEDKVTTAQYTAHKQHVGAVVTAMAPDIVAFAEIENQGVLDSLNAEDLGGVYGNRVLIDGNDPRLIDVGVMSKLPFDQVVSHKDDMFTRNGTMGPTYQYSRDCLEVHLTYNGRKIVLLAVHFRAKAGTDDPDKRLAEAQHTRSIADGLAASDPSALIVVLGDYNDTPGSDPVNAVTGADPAKFTDAAESVASPDRYSFVFMGTNELIDHQMSNPPMAALLDASSVVIRHGSDVDAASDHAPVMATYLVR